MADRIVACMTLATHSNTCILGRSVWFTGIFSLLCREIPARWSVSGCFAGSFRIGRPRCGDLAASFLINDYLLNETFRRFSRYSPPDDRFSHASSLSPPDDRYSYASSLSSQKTMILCFTETDEEPIRRFSNSGSRSGRRGRM